MSGQRYTRKMLERKLADYHKAGHGRLANGSLIEDPMDIFIDDMMTGDPETRRAAAKELLPFIHPKLKQVEADVTVTENPVERLLGEVTGASVGPPGKRTIQ